MDPNETLKLFVHALRDGDHDAAIEHYEELSDWITRGGFEPAWRGAKKVFDAFNPETGLVNLEEI